MNDNRQVLLKTHITGRQRDAQHLILSPETFATPLFLLGMDRFHATEDDPGMLGDADNPPWSAETVRLEYQAEFQAILPDANLDKVMALVTILTTDLFFQDVKSFIQLCNILAGDTFDPLVFDPATCMEMAWAITEAMLLEPPDSDEPFCDEIRYYIGHMLQEEGFTSPPDVLRIAKFDKPLTDPLAIWSDDPELYQSAFAVQQEKVDNLKAMIRDNTLAMTQQIKMLPLEHGSTDGLMPLWQKGLQNFGR